ncbi:MAG: ClpXP protease specificity-enhancing factor SspB, partial [Gammaproteobacteria bacterium]
GVAQEIIVPVASVRAVYAKENGQGLAFEAAGEVPSDTPDAPPPTAGDEGRTTRKPPQLTIVK